jgi:glycosyltransferase involved in cell wall biosynthesis
VSEDKRPRVVHVINSLAMGGAETMLARIVHAGQTGPFEHVVLPLLPGGGVEDRVRETGAWVEPLGVRGPRNLLTAPYRLAGRLRALEPDLVQGWLLQGNLAAVIGTRLAHVRAPVLWNVRWTLYDVTSEPLRTQALLRLSGLLGRFPERIIYNSRLAVSQHAAIGFPRRLAQVIPNGFDLDRFQPDPAARAAMRLELNVPSSSRVIGMLARYHPMKDHTTSLRAAARVVERGVDAVFVYAGRDVDNTNAELLDLAERLGLSGRVRFLGERQDVARLFASFDLYWMSSLSRGLAEGFPNVIAEAMGAGVPCVATNSGDAAWIIGQTGRTVPAGDPQALGNAAADLLLADPGAFHQMGLDARARIGAEFSLHAVMAAYDALYKDVLA